MREFIKDKLQDAAGVGLFVLMMALAAPPAFLYEFWGQCRYWIYGYPKCQRGSTDSLEEIERKYQEQHKAIYNEVAKQAK